MTLRVFHEQRKDEQQLQLFKFFTATLLPKIVIKQVLIRLLFSKDYENKKQFENGCQIPYGLTKRNEKMKMEATTVLCFSFIFYIVR